MLDHMKLSSIGALLKGQMSSAEFKFEIFEEIGRYSSALKKPGGSVPINVEEDQDIIVRSKDVSVLCVLYVSGMLSSIEISYLADALQLSERVDFSDDDVGSYIDEMTDSEVNGVFTKERALEIMRHVV